MCHRNKANSALQLPPSCRAAADSMEQALREEDAAGYTVADITAAANSLIRTTERALQSELKKEIVLVAYEPK